MKKMKMYGMGNEDKFNYYIFEKNQETIELLSKIFQDILGNNLPLYEEPLEEENYKWKKRKFNKLIDVHEKIDSYPKKNSRVDIFYGQKKIFVTIHCSLRVREKFNEAVGEISKMSNKKGRKCQK